ncbi:MAG TPA: hypothetical protein VGJ41_06275 [Nocardioides sp.]
MSNEWDAAGRPGRSREGRRGRAPRPSQPLVAAQDARAALQEQFYRVDQFQSDIGGTVKLYAGLVADRASRTGVVPGWEALDSRANELIIAYLGLLDRYDPLEERMLPELQQARREFADLTPKLGLLGNDMEGYLDRFGPELQKVGEAKQAVERRVAEAVAKVDQAEAAWRKMTAEGLEFQSADQAIAQARIAARKLAAAAPTLTADRVDEPARVVEKLAAEALTQATDLPRRAAGLRNRIPSLATRIQALETRAQSVPEAMRALRREFSLGNWKDIADRETDVEKLLDDARTRLRDLRRLHDSGDLNGALAQLGLLEDSLAAAGEVVDGPRDRLEELRGIRQNPRGLFDKARFNVRDARFLVMKGRTVAPQPWAGRLDAAAAELIAMETMLEGAHPDYWALKRRMDTLNARVKELIDDFRRDQ